MVPAGFDDLDGVPPGSAYDGFLTPAVENGGRTAKCVLRVRPVCCNVCVAAAGGGSSIAAWSVVAAPGLKEPSLFIYFAFLLVFMDSGNTILADFADKHSCYCLLIGLHDLLTLLRKHASVCLCVYVLVVAGGRYI